MRDALTSAGELVGIAAITFGIWCVFPPAAFIFGGLAVFAISFLQGRSK